MSEPPAPRCLCIVSSDPVRSGELLAALRTRVDTHERLEVIVDRRRGESGSVTDPPSNDRRRQPFVDVKVKTDGFAIVPYSSSSPAGTALHEADQPAPPLFDADPAEQEYARVVEFGRQRRARRHRRLAVTSALGTALVLLTLVPAMKFMSRTRPAGPPPAESPPAIASSPPLRPTAPSPPSGGAVQRSESAQRSESTSPAVERTGRPRVAARPPAAERASQPSVQAAPAPMAAPSPQLAPPPVAAPPSEGTSPPQPPAQASKAPEILVPRPQPGASTQAGGSAQTPEPARLPEAAPSGPAPVRPHEVAPTRPAPRSPEAAPARQALGRPPDSSPPRQAPTASIPDASSASSRSSPSDPAAGGLGDQFKNLGTVIERDLIDATADAKRQGDDFKAIQNRFRRAWEGLKQSFVGPTEKSRE